MPPVGTIREEYVKEQAVVLTKATAMIKMAMIP